MKAKINNLIRANGDNPITDPSRMVINISVTITALLVLFFLSIIDTALR